MSVLSTRLSSQRICKYVHLGNYGVWACRAAGVQLYPQITAAMKTNVIVLGPLGRAATYAFLTMKQNKRRRRIHVTGVSLFQDSIYLPIGSILNRLFGTFDIARIISTLRFPRKAQHHKAITSVSR